MAYQENGRDQGPVESLETMGDEFWQQKNWTWEGMAEWWTENVFVED